jgi:outer membrane lipoprotein SlyB
MSKVVMVVGAFVCGVIGGLIGQAIAGSKGFAVGAAVGFLAGFCVIGAIVGMRERQQAAETTAGPPQDEE